jgi:dTDP-4-dehydrorhamnose 3,5-epimerase
VSAALAALRHHIAHWSTPRTAFGIAVMKIEASALADVLMITPKRFGDARGFFSETYSKPAFADAGLVFEFVQDNHSYSAAPGVVRGLHYQLPPAAQDKLVRVVRGAILDVAVDIRRASPTFGRHVTLRLSAEAWNQALVPVGFAHGFCTLEPDTEVLYKVSAPYAPDLERGVLWNDPDLGIDWPVEPAVAVVSDRDRTHPRLRDAVDLL